MPRKSSVKKNSLALDPDVNADKAREHMSNVSEPQSSAADHGMSASPEAQNAVSAADDTINALRYEHRKRRWALEARKSGDLRLGAFLRMMLGWRKDLPDAERKAIRDRADAIAKSPDDTEWADIVAAHNQGQAPFLHVEKVALKNMERLAKTLPVWKSFGQDVRGFGAASLAVIIAETGDLDGYASIAKVWKRMGLAVMGSVRQGGLAKGAGAEAWIAHGYSPARRSLAWNIGDTMLKAQVRREKDDAGEDTGGRYALGPYGQAYLDRKAYELAREPDMQPIKAHRRAQRYMEKRLLKHLWQAWRRDHNVRVERPGECCPDAEPFKKAA